MYSSMFSVSMHHHTHTPHTHKCTHTHVHMHKYTHTHTHTHTHNDTPTNKGIREKYRTFFIHTTIIQTIYVKVVFIAFNSACLCMSVWVSVWEGECKRECVYVSVCVLWGVCLCCGVCLCVCMWGVCHGVCIVWGFLWSCWIHNQKRVFTFTSHVDFCLERLCWQLFLSQKSICSAYTHVHTHIGR